jgi:hypothetical protein
VNPRAFLRLASILLLASSLGGCAHHEPPPPTIVAAPAGASPEALRWAIEGALAERHWNVLRREPGRIGAYVSSQGTGDQALVEITYGSGDIQVRLVQEADDRQRSERWVRLLAGDIQRNVASIGMGKPPPPPPPPPP